MYGQKFRYFIKNDDVLQNKMFSEKHNIICIFTYHYGVWMSRWQL